MPNAWEQNAVYLQSGNPEGEDTPTLQEPGLLGARFTVMNPARGSTSNPSRSKRYQLVKTDSTMTVAPYNGAVAYWSDRTNYVVTTARTVLNNVAGVFRNSITKGNYGCVQVTGSGYVKMVDGDVGAMVAGDIAIGSSATDGKAARVASGTAPTNVPLGRASSPITKLAADALVLCDLDVPETT